MRKASALGAAVALFVLLAALGADFAFASSLLRAIATSPSTAATSAFWSVAPVLSTGSSAPGVALSWTNPTSVSSHSFYLKNFGSLSTVQFTITLTTGSTTSTLQECSLFGIGVSPGTNTTCAGGTWTAITAVSGGIGGVVSATSTTPVASVVSITLPVVSWLFVRVSDSQSKKSDSISLSITNSGPNSGIRTATTTNS